MFKVLVGLFEFLVVVEGGEEFGICGGDLDDVFDVVVVEVWVIEVGFDGDDGVGFEFVVDCVDVGGFVDGEVEVVVGVVEEIDGVVFCVFGFVVLFFEYIEVLLVDGVFIDVGVDFFEGGFLGFVDGGDEVVLGVGGVVFEEGVGYVVVVVGGLDVGEDIDDDEFVGVEWVGVVVVWIVGLVVVGGDGVD